MVWQPTPVFLPGESPWTKNLGGLQSMGSQSGGHNWLSRAPHSTALGAQMVKNLPALWETWVWSLSWEEPLEKEMATHSSILAWRIPWTKSMGLQRVRHDWVSNTFTFTYFHEFNCHRYSTPYQAPAIVRYLHVPKTLIPSGYSFA